MDRTKIGILFQASNEFGYGHLYRAIRLGNLLKQYYEVYLISNFNHDCKLLAEDSELNLAMLDDLDVAGFLHKKEIQVLIVDRLKNALDTIVGYKQVVKRIIIMDDDGPAAICGDVLINAIMPLPEPHPEQSFQGINYMVFSDDIERYACLQPNKRENFRKVLVTFGGSDPNNISELMIPVVKENKSVNFIMVIGPGYIDGEGFIAKYQSIDNLEILQNVTNMPALMYDSDLCIVSGGLTLFECVYLQKSIVVACQVEHQIKNADNLKEMGSIRNLGIVNKYNKEKLNEISRLLHRELEFPKVKSAHLENGKYAILNIVNQITAEL